MKPAKKKLKKKKFSAPGPAPVSLGDPEMDAIFAKIYTMKEDIDSKLNQLTDITGMSSQEITTYLTNPNNFTPKQWEKMEKDRKATEEKLYLGLGVAAKQQTTKKVLEKKDRERRGKMIGARKKWMPM